MTGFNSARYCDGLDRQFTVKLKTGGKTDLYGAIGKQTCSDPVDCVALTYAEAVKFGTDWANNNRVACGIHLEDLITGNVAEKPELFFEVIALPDGWKND